MTDSTVLNKQKYAKIIWLSPEEITPYIHNPRNINDDAVLAVAESIRKYGWRQELVLQQFNTEMNAENVIVCGHTRRLAAIKLGHAKIPCQITDMNDEEAREYRIIDNKSGEKAQWNFQLLSYELNQIDCNQDVILYNFPQMELDTIMQADFQPSSDPEPKSRSSKEKHVLHLSPDQFRVVQDTIHYLKEHEPDLGDEGAYLARICQDYMSFSQSGDSE
jgi:hypothetical protein